MSRPLRAYLDKIHPGNIKCDTTMESNTVARTINADDQEFIRNYTHCDKWLKAIVIDTAGPVTYVTQLLSVQIARRHVNQLRRRYDNLTSGAPDPNVIVNSPMSQCSATALQTDLSGISNGNGDPDPVNGNQGDQAGLRCHSRSTSFGQASIIHRRTMVYS